MSSAWRGTPPGLPYQLFYDSFSERISKGSYSEGNFSLILTIFPPIYKRYLYSICFGSVDFLKRTFASKRVQPLARGGIRVLKEYDKPEAESNNEEIFALMGFKYTHHSSTGWYNAWQCKSLQEYAHRTGSYFDQSLPDLMQLIILLHRCVVSPIWISHDLRWILFSLAELLFTIKTIQVYNLWRNIANSIYDNRSNLVQWVKSTRKTNP